MSSAPANLADEVREYLSDLRQVVPAVPLDISVESSIERCELEVAAAQTRIDVLGADLKQGQHLKAQLEEYQPKLQKELPAYLSDIGLTLHRVEGNGQTFFDETLQLRGVIGLLNQKATADSYRSFVLPDVDHAIDRHVDDIVEWLVTSELTQWKDLATQVDGDDSPLSGVISEQLDTRLDYDRSRLSTSLGCMVDDTMELFDAIGQSKAVAEAARNAAANSLFLAVAAVIALAAVAAPGAAESQISPVGVAATLAALAVAVIPWARRRAKKQLARMITALRVQLEKDLTYRIEKEIQTSHDKIGEIVDAPLDATQAEYDKLLARFSTLSALKSRGTLLQQLITDNTVGGVQ